MSMRYARRILLRALSSVLLPTRFRSRLLAALGADLSRTTVIHSGFAFDSLKIRTGNNVFINSGFYFDGLDHLTIGDRVSIGPFVRVITAGHDTTSPHRRCSPQAVTAPVRIGNGSWIGGSAVILPGVTIAEGCVVAAGAVVHRSTSSHGLYAGVPARRVKSLPTTEV